MPAIYQIDELRPAVGIRWFRATGDHQLETLEDPAVVWPIGQPLELTIKCWTHRNHLPKEDRVNMMVVALMGWGNVTVEDEYWQAQYAEPIAIIETQQQLREAVLKTAESYVLPVRHDWQPDDAIKDFEGFEKTVKDIYAK